MRDPRSFVEFLQGNYSPPTGHEPVVRPPAWVRPNFHRPHRTIEQPPLPVDQERRMVFGPGAVTGETPAPWDTPPMTTTPLPEALAPLSGHPLPDALLVKDTASWRNPTTGEEGHQAFQPPDGPADTPDDLDAAWNAAVARARATRQPDPTGLRAQRDETLAPQRVNAAIWQGLSGLADLLNPQRRSPAHPDRGR